MVRYGEVTGLKLFPHNRDGFCAGKVDRISRRTTLFLLEALTPGSAFM